MTRRGDGSKPPLGFRVLAGLLSWYALCGFTLALLAVTRRAVTVDWRVLAAAGVLLGATTGAAALAVWRSERRALPWLVASAVAALLFCLALPLSLRGGEVPARTWRSAIFGALMFSSFLALAAVYVRMRLDRR